MVFKIKEEYRNLSGLGGSLLFQLHGRYVGVCYLSYTLLHVPKNPYSIKKENKSIKATGQLVNKKKEISGFSFQDTREHRIPHQEY